MNSMTGQSGRRLESLSLLMGAAGFLAGGVVALLLLQPPATLFGKDSIGEVAALMGGAVSGVAFLIVMLVMAGTRCRGRDGCPGSAARWTSRD